MYVHSDRTYNQSPAVGVLVPAGSVGVPVSGISDTTLVGVSVALAVGSAVSEGVAGSVADAVAVGAAIVMVTVGVLVGVGEAT